PPRTPRMRSGASASGVQHTWNTMKLHIMCLHGSRRSPVSRPALPFSLPLEQLHISVWHDPVVDAVGHDPRSPYVERFWTALLGPSTTLLVRRIAAELERQPDGFALDLEETAKAIGLGMRGGANGPFLRAVARTGQFHIS